MNGLLLLLLDTLRDRFGDCHFTVHCGYGAADHTKHSEHKRGNAVDFHIDSALSLIDQAARIETILRGLQVHDRVGLGVYPDWNDPGFHLDVRGVFARWGRIGQNYVGWEEALKDAAATAQRGLPT